MRPRLLLLGAATLLAACASRPGSESLSFAQMQTLNAGVPADWILEEYPFANDVVRGPGGRVRSMRYSVEDPSGKGHTLVLEFDEAGVLVRKRYSGPIVRPTPAERGSERP